MIEEAKNEVEQRYAGLTTAALAEAGDAAIPGDRSAPVATAATAVKEAQATPLFSAAEAKEFRVRWDAIQGGFVDEPRLAVEQADSLVAGAMKRLAEMFAQERTNLEGQWDRQETASTEDLRLALRRYRSFFARVLSV